MSKTELGDIIGAQKREHTPIIENWHCGIITMLLAHDWLGGLS
jgi:hypothetical protein